MAMKARYSAAMLLAGVGDALGYGSGKWEFCKDGLSVHRSVAKLGGLSKIWVSLERDPRFIVSDDTVMHLATARALVRSNDMENGEAMSVFAEEYIECMLDMDRRAAGNTCIGSCAALESIRAKNPKEFRIPFNKRAGGCGAAMRSMCIGLRYPDEVNLNDLIRVSIESGRITHHHPTAYLGSLTAALFTSYALQGKPVINWGSHMMNTVLPLAKQYIKDSDVEVEENIQAWSYFERAWVSYLKTRNLTSGETEPNFPVPYDVKERDEFYTSISYSGWGGASGHDSVIIAYDALLGAKDSWEELCNRATLHGGDNDSTGTIASCWFGALYGMDSVYESHHKEVEYRDEMLKLADQLYSLSHSPADV